ncbi:MAG: uroporphyrinogen decarboxylase family protein [Planctomycetota bacterium]|jgi:uroporphyrinogen decarboxylase
MIRKKKLVYSKVKQAYDNGKRLIAPLVGFPGCNLTGFSIKVAQQNHRVHYACIKALVENLKPDIAFLLMDLSVEANALGLPVRFPTHESSTVEQHPIESLEQLDEYRRIDILRDSRVISYIKTVEMMRIGLPSDILVAAYVIGPLTLAGLLRSVQQIAIDSILQPQLLHGLCQFATEFIQKYAAALTNAGADIICILEPSAMMLGPEQFRQFSGDYVRHIMESYKYDNVETVYHVCGNTMHLVKEMAATGVAALSLDSPEHGIDLQKAADMVPYDVIVMGNISPTSVITDGSVETVKKATKDLLEKMRRYPNFVLATACDIPQNAPIENIKAFMETARYFK